MTQGTVNVTFAVSIPHLQWLNLRKENFDNNRSAALASIIDRHLVIEHRVNEIVEMGRNDTMPFEEFEILVKEYTNMYKRVPDFGTPGNRKFEIVERQNKPDTNMLTLQEMLR